MPIPVIAIVGRPNVGKSTLFNRLIKKQKAIIDDRPGVTRDRIYATFSWGEQDFLLIDTGGLESNPGDSLVSQVYEQAHLAIEEADLIIFLLDGQEGLLPADKEIFLKLKKSLKPLLCTVNKIDNQKLQLNLSDFYSLGGEDLFSISSAHGLGINALMEKAICLLPSKKSKEYPSDIIKLAIIGRPNVGKSSLLNKILREERSLVSEIPGTTRDCLDTTFNYNHHTYLLIDTAGIRRRKKVKEKLERVTILKTIKNIEEAHVALFLIDASQDISEQDVRIAGIAHEAGRAIIIVVNKWDIVKKDDKTMKKYEKEYRYHLKYLNYAPIIFVSALTGQRIYAIFSLVEQVYAQYTKRITTGKLNRVIHDMIKENPPPLHKKKKLKFYYQAQTSIRPPTFTFFVNHPEGIHFSYKRYLQNHIRDRLNFELTPLRLIFRPKD